MLKGSQKLSFVVLYHDGDKHFVPGLIESLPKFNELILVKTIKGVKDRHRHISTKLENDILISEYEIEYKELHFANLRNKAKEFASCDWIVSLDADERISMTNADIDLILKQPEKIGGLYLTLTSLSKRETQIEAFTIRVIRIFKKRFNWRFRVHEQIGESIVEAGYFVKDTDVLIRHLGYMVGEKDKAKRNFDLLLKANLEHDSEYLKYKLWQTASSLMPENRHYKEMAEGGND